MSYIPLQKMIEHCPCLYKLVLGAAERANELNEGVEPLVKSTSKKVTSIAMEEIIAGKVRVHVTPMKKGKAKKQAAVPEE